MAVLISLDKKANIELIPVRYEQKNEFWFSATVVFIWNEKVLIKGTGSFHLNDFVRLITEIKSFLINRQSEFFVFDPIEPYFNIKITKSNGGYCIDASFNQGPVFESSGYRKTTFITSRENLIKFIEEIIIDLRKLDPKIKIKAVTL